MRRTILLLLFMLAGYPLHLFAQLSDSFSDGNFNTNPAWIGDTTHFVVNSSLQLQLNALAAGSSYLTTQANVPVLTAAEWQFFIRLNFSPSANNNARVYLVSDQANLKGPLNGYYLQFGESGSNDAIELFRQTGTTTVSVARGFNGFISSAFAITVKVTRDINGLWSLYADAAAGNNFTLQATGTDTQFTSCQWFGIVCNYTSSNVSNFYFDDFTWPHQPDTTPPVPLSVVVVSATQLDVLFDEAVDAASAELESNYSVNNNIGQPQTAQRNTTNLSLVHLTFTTAFQNGISYVLTITGIADLNGNVMPAAVGLSFNYVVPAQPAPYDVVINEIMADPSPAVQLPEFEYLEIFNRSGKTLDLTNWTITAGTTVKVFGNIMLLPGSYLILCTPAASAILSAYGNTVPLFTSSTTLTNDGTSLLLKDASGQVIDSVVYSDSWYRDPQKNDGGWSLERINPDFTCHNPMNWKASVDSRGGTPGGLNSVNGNFSDTEPPQLLRAYLNSATRVVAVFSEPLDPTQLLNPFNYSVNNAIGTPVSVILLSSVEAELTLAQMVQAGMIYILTVNPAVTDCPGNMLEKNTARFAQAEIPSISDILISEVLYRPFDDGAEFVEIYNRSQKVIDLGAIKIARVNPDNTLQTAYNLSFTPWLIFSGEYYVITTDPQAVKSHYYTPHPDHFLMLNTMPSLTDDGAEFALIAPDGKRIDQLRYSPAWQFALLNDDKGVSLERISFNRPTQDSTNWHSAAESVGFATPAYRNSQYSDAESDGSEVSVTPEIFSPDNDGHHDVLFINYAFDRPGYLANLKIFDGQGREIIHLVKNQLLGTEGSFTWDGITASRQKAPLGIYVLWLELFHDTGRVKKLKKTFVLAGRL